MAKSGTTQPATDSSKSKSSFGFGGKLFAGTRGFDPAQIIASIISMQFLYYFTLSVSIMLVDFIFGLRPHLGQIFNPSAFDLSLNYSYATLLANCLNMIFVVMALAYVVEKANKCLDYVLTIFIYHVIFTWAVYRFPSGFYWWFLQGLIVIFTVLLGEYVCLRLETAEIKLSVGHILEKGIEKGKEIGQKGIKEAQKIINKDKKDQKTGNKDKSKPKRKKDKSEIV